MTTAFAADLTRVLNRSARTPIKDQLCAALRDAVLSGQVPQGARLPSWQNLASQLGVARGTVRAAYDRLIGEQLIVSAGAAGTYVTNSLPVKLQRDSSIQAPMRAVFPTFSSPPLPFQLGVPAHDAFPAKLWARLATRSARWHSTHPTSYPDPRGEPTLRRAIASHLAVARGIRATADQIIVTNGRRAALNIIIRGLKLEGCEVWLEDPGCSITRTALEIAGVEAISVPVDSDGIVVERGIELARDAALVIVTPSQQAPLGMAQSPERRAALLAWAEAANAWIVEDDHLGELQLDGRSVPALAADDPQGRVIHVGTFSKTISPHLVLGYIVVPAMIAERLGDAAAYLAPAPDVFIQHSLAMFMTEGCFARHLARMRRLYRLRRDALAAELAGFRCTYIGCLSLLIRLPNGRPDTVICEEAYRHGISPAPFSSWFRNSVTAPRGLMLCVTNCRPDRLAEPTTVLRTLIGSVDI